jgi:CheY-like chemotaxis protein
MHGRRTWTAGGASLSCFPRFTAISTDLRDWPRDCSIAGEEIAMTTTRALTVLVVDDDELIRRCIHRMLWKAGHRVIAVQDGAAALQKAAEDGPFDVLVTDLMMPEMSGDELGRRMRILQPELPILYLTGFSRRLFADRHVLRDGEAFLDKPCTAAGLLEAITSVINLAGWDRRIEDIADLAGQGQGAERLG